MDKYMKFSDLLEYLRSRNDEARRCGHEKTYFDLLTIIDGLKNVDTVPASALDKDIDVPTKEAIPYQWIVDYLTWLKDIGEFALPDANAIKSMLKKWEMEQGHSGCGPDYCNI